MKSIICLLALAVFGLQPVFCFGQSPDDETSQLISIGTKEKLYSKVLEEEREIWVHVPEAIDDQDKFPVLYLLDGEFNFETVVGVMKANVLNGLIPEMVIIAIPNNNRFRDLTTSHVGDDTNPSGGAGKFTQFIETELIPYIDEKYPTISYRTIIGHSLGGLVVVNTLIHHPHLFSNYIAIDPSLSWDKEGFMETATSTVRETNYENKALYTAIANTLPGEMSFEEALEDTTTHSLHLRSIQEFSKVAQSNEWLVSDWKYYENEAHGTLPLAAENDALRFLFSWYKFDEWREFFSPESELTGTKLVELMVGYNDRISEKMGHQFPLREEEVNQLGFMYLDMGNFERARPFFEWNLEQFPESANAHDSMGDYFARTSDAPNAIKSYSKSLELGGVEGTKEKLEKLKGQKD